MPRAVGGESEALCDLEMLGAEFDRLHTQAIGPRLACPYDSKALPAMSGPSKPYEDFFRQVHDLDGDGRTALCLSGGGIRGAAFNLGVLQALAAAGFLDKFHYLSTVSGGGYIGCWLALWRRRAGLKAVVNGLGWPALDEPSLDAEDIVAPDAIRSLRGKTSYLAPRMGLMSSDTWTALVLYLRNLLLNLLILIPILAALVLLPKFILGSIDLLLEHRAGVGSVSHALLKSMIVIWVLGWTVLALARPAWTPHGARMTNEQAKKAQRRSRKSAKFGSALILVVSFLYGLFAIGWVELTPAEDYPVILGGCAFGAVAGALAFLLSVICGLVTLAWAGLRVEQMRPDAPKGLRLGWFFAGQMFAACWRAIAVRTFLVWLGASFSGAVGGGFLGAGLLLAQYFWGRDDQAVSWIFCLGPLWLIIAHLIGDTLYLGLTARRKKDPREQARDPWGDLEREWLARSGGLMLTWIGVTTAFLLFDLFAGPIWSFAEGAPWKGYYTAATGVISFGGSVLLGFSSLTGGNWGQDKQSRLPFQAILVFATPVFALILVSGISRLVDAGLGSTGFIKAVETSIDAVMGQPRSIHWTEQMPLAAVGIELLALIVFLALGLAASFLININRFSLHDLYRLRLMREFLGASNPGHEREADGWTGFTDADDDDLASLWSRKGGSSTELWKPCLYPVINTTLNLVEPNRLAWQERKGEPFVFTPDHVGSVRLGYRSAEEAAGGVRISSAMTISGAAVSPNAGYSTVPGLSLLMTMFNLRLGVWVGNPHDPKCFRRRGPGWALRPLLAEAFAYTTEKSTTKYVFLSDGGHFDNLGLYEMLRRRCRYIVASDAGCDPNYAFEDLGRVVRQVSIDMGIRITFQQLSMAKRPEPGAAPAATDQAYFAVATIEYPERISIDGKTGPALGYLLYIKPGFQNRSEPADVRAFAAANPAFPHDSTVNQFFGESQFESYRSLGRHIVRDLVGPLDQAAPAPPCLSNAFQKARARLAAIAAKPPAS